MVFNKAATLVYQPNKVCRCYQTLDFTSDMHIFPLPRETNSLFA